MTLHTLEQATPDTQTLLREANHRIANHLAMLASAVQLQASALSKGPDMIPRAEARGMLQEVASKIVTMGNLHRRMADEKHGHEIDLGDFLIETCSTLVSSLALGDRLHITHRLDTHCRVPAERAQPIVLLVSEIAMNALKHAHPTGLPVQLLISCNRTADGGLVVEVSDDGVGLPEGFDTVHDGGVGFRLMRALADKLGARLKVESDSLGTTFRLTLPSEEKRVIALQVSVAS